MKTLLLRYTVPIEVDVPDDFPVTTDEIEKTADWRRNDYSDGRYPFASELLHDAALRAARSDLGDAIDNHYCRRIEAWATQHDDCWKNHERHMEARNTLIKRCLDKLGYLKLVDGGTVETTAMWHPLTERYTYDPHVVIARGDMCIGAWGEYGPFNIGDYELATRTVFAGREAAEAYAAGISRYREPIVTKLPISELRVGEERGQLDYWRP